MTPFKSWLLRRRPYCEHRLCMKEATRVLKINNKDECRCDEHGYEQQQQQHKIEKEQEHA